MTEPDRWVPFVFEGRTEAAPGSVWQAVFDAKWPAYREWFLREGESARPSYADGVRAIRLHMPELMPVYERLVDLAGGSDLAARFLSMWDPPPYLSACSQVAWTKGPPGEGPVLVRNYDYAPSRFEGVVWSTAWTGRQVLGMSDCAWGLLDGMNGSGMAVSLAFGGRRVLGHGFGIPLVLRYVLETCEDVTQARDALDRVPVNLAYNLTVLDANGAFLTAFVGPDQRPRFADVACTTNHQDAIEWPEHAEATRSVERQAYMVNLLDHMSGTSEAFAAAFLDPPLYAGSGDGRAITLYTAEYRPREGRVCYRWPDSSWDRSFGSGDSSHRALIPAVR